MDYMTLREASEKWGISTRQINYYCTEDRILGAVKMAGVGCCQKRRRSQLMDEQDKGGRIENDATL